MYKAAVCNGLIFILLTSYPSLSLTMVSIEQQVFGGISSEIITTPATLDVVVAPGEMVETTFNIANAPSATDDLIWSEATNGTVEVVLSQIENPGFSLPSNFFQFETTGFFVADDFELQVTTDIHSVIFWGFVNNGGDLEFEADLIRVYIYADDNGRPTGYPTDGLGTEVFEVPVPIADPNVVTTNNDIQIDIAGFTGLPVTLAPGKYWIVVAPIMMMDANNSNFWYWTMVNNNGTSNGLFIDPDQLITNGATDWVNIVNVGAEPSRANLNYQIATQQQCGAPWFTLNPDNGVINSNASTDVSVTINAFGLASGEHHALICIDSNDVNVPRLAVPISLLVDETLDIIFTSGFDSVL